MKISITKINTLHGHKGSLYALEYDRKRSKIYTAGADGAVAVWNSDNLEIGSMLVKMPNSIYALQVLPNHLLVGQNNEGIHLIDLAQKQEAISLKLGNVSIFDIQLLDDTALLSLSNGVLVVLDLPSFSIKKYIKSSDQSIRSMALDPQKKQIALAYSDEFVRIFSTTDWTPTKQIHAHENSVFGISYNGDGTELLTVSRDAHLKVWDTTTYTLKNDIKAHMGNINDIAFDPTFCLYATCSMDKTIKIWDASTHTLLKVIDNIKYEGHTNSINKVIWINHQTLASISDDRTMSVWGIEIL